MSHISYSAFKNWTVCPYYYKLTYEDRISLFNGNIYTAFGTAVHKACEEILLGTDVDIKKLFKDSFKQNLKELPEEEIAKLSQKSVVDFYNQGDAILEYIMPEVIKHFGDDFEVFSVEEDLMIGIEDFDNLENLLQNLHAVPSIGKF